MIRRRDEPVRSRGFLTYGRRRHRSWSEKRAGDRSHLASVDDADVAADVVQVPLRVQLEVVGNAEPKQKTMRIQLEIVGNTERNQKYCASSLTPLGPLSRGIPVRDSDQNDG